MLDKDNLNGGAFLAVGNQFERGTEWCEISARKAENQRVLSA